MFMDTISGQVILEKFISGNVRASPPRAHLPTAHALDLDLSLHQPWLHPAARIKYFRSLLLSCGSSHCHSFDTHLPALTSSSTSILIMAFIQKGIKNILQKNPQDVVFLSALRTPVTRAKKGGLRDAYEHELLGAVRQAPFVQ